MAYPQLSSSSSYLEIEYARKKRSIHEIASDVGCNVETVRLALRRHGIQVRKSRDYRKLVISKRELLEWYVKKDMTAYQISRMFHCCERKISAKLRAFGIPTKRLQKQDLRKNLQGERFGKLFVKNIHHTEDDGDIFWECSCDCGNTIVTRARNLLRIE